MIILSLATTLLIGYFLPIWIYKIHWITLFKVAFQIGKINTLKELFNSLKISQATAFEYIFTMIGLCVLIYIIMYTLTKILKTTLNKNQTNEIRIDTEKEEILNEQHLKAKKSIYIFLLIIETIMAIIFFFGIAVGEYQGIFIMVFTFTILALVATICAFIINKHKIIAQNQYKKIKGEKK